MKLAAVIAAQRAEHRIPYAVACRAVGVSQAWFYKWRRGDVSVRRKRRGALAALIGLLFAQHHGSYGSPRIWKDLQDSGWRMSKNTVAALMAEQHLVARPKRKRQGLAKADKSARKAPDELKRDLLRTHEFSGQWPN